MPILLTSYGRKLSSFSVDRDGSSEKIAVIDLPHQIQYAAYDDRRGLLIVACSDGSPGNPGTRHLALALAVLGGQFSILPHSIELPARPIHVALAPSSGRVAFTYCEHPGLSVHGYDTNGLEGPIASDVSPAAHYPHQSVFLDDGRVICLVCRGTDATPSLPENPGSIRTYAVVENRLEEHEVIALDDGIGSGPRNFVLSPCDGTAYASLERQNQLVAFRWPAFDAESPNTHRQSSLAAPGSYSLQMAGPVRIHPTKKILYQSNRTHRTSGCASEVYLGDGENSLVVYDIGKDPCVPTLLQRVTTAGIHPRTFSLDDRGEMLAVANLRGVALGTGAASQRLAPCISLFSVNDNGCLTYLSKIEFPPDDLLFWSSFLSSTPIPARGHAD